MRRTLLCGCSLLIFVVAPALARAADLALPNIKGPPILVSAWDVQFGARYWYSSGKHQFDLNEALHPAIEISRLTFGNLEAHSAEVFFRADHESGVFLKGYLGGGSIVSGKLNDEDFPPLFPVPYSNTISTQRNGSLKYGSVDLGNNLFAGSTYRLGPFGGYHNFHERLNTFGCFQLAATDPLLCGLDPELAVIPVPALFDGQDEDVTWQSIRAGVAGGIVLAPGLKFSGEAAWTHNFLQNTDYHNFRPDIRGTKQDGEGNGFQLEGVLAYDVTPNFDIGLGGRYWRFQASGKSHWEQTLAGVLSGIPSAPLRTVSERYGVFVQAGYRFGGPSNGPGSADGFAFGKVEAGPHDWSGFYIGANVGYGFGESGLTQLSPLSPEAVVAQGLLAIPAAQKSDVAGFVGGGQAGYDFQIDKNFVAGLEADIAYANIGGSFGNTALPVSRFFPLTATTTQNLHWLGTVRGRLGFLGRDDLLLYGTGGLAYGGTAARGAFEEFFPTFAGGISADCTRLSLFCSAGEASNASVGWTAGGGVEYAIARNFSLKAEYLFVDLGTQTYTLSAGRSKRAARSIFSPASTGGRISSAPA